MLAVGNARQFKALCGLLDLPETAPDPRFVTNGTTVTHVIDQIADAMSREEGPQTW